MKRRAGLLSVLSAIALVFAVVSFVLHYLTATRLFEGGDFAFAVANAVAGVALGVASLVGNLEATRARFRSGGARRARRDGANAIAQTAIWIAVLVVLAVFSTQTHRRWDWTEAQRHSLTSQSLKVLEGLQRDVDVAAIFQSAVAEPARAFLERYELAAPDRFHVEFVDPNAQPARLQALGVPPASVGEGVVHVAIGDESVDVQELTEEALTNALVRLTRLERKKVYFLDGHNERPIQDDGAENVDGFSQAAEALRNENYEVETLLLAAMGDVPEDADVVIAAGPTRPYHETEHAALARYVAGGGALLVLLDPRAKTDLYDDLEAWGVTVGDDVVVDLVQSLPGRPYAPFAVEYADHPITRELGDTVLFNTARSVAGAEGSGFTALVRTGQTSWAERDMARLIATNEAEPDPEVDVVGGVTVAVAGERGDGDPPARLVVMGDSDFATNQLIREFRNRDLFVNAVNWLLGDVEAISIRPGQPRASRLRLSQAQFETVRIVALFVTPELIALVGAGVWWSRRRAPGR